MHVEFLKEVSSLIIVAFALGLDGFSVSLGFGMQHIRLRHIATIGGTIGLFHIILPLFGIIVGQIASKRIEFITSLIGGSILIFLGAHIFFSSLRKTTLPLTVPKGVHLIPIAFAVSIDSLPVGISLGLTNVHVLLTVLVIGSMAMVLSWSGMLLGRKASVMFGIYSELLGGFILFCLGLAILFLS